jgi:hypothetical protein
MGEDSSGMMFTLNFTKSDQLAFTKPARKYGSKEGILVLSNHEITPYEENIETAWYTCLPFCRWQNLFEYYVFGLLSICENKCLFALSSFNSNGIWSVPFIIYTCDVEFRLKECLFRQARCTMEGHSVFAAIMYLTCYLFGPILCTTSSCNGPLGREVLEPVSQILYILCPAETSRHTKYLKFIYSCS